MPLLPALRLASVFIVVAGLLGLPAGAREEHPHMHRASELIRKAQGSATPEEDLREALRRLRAAKDNKGGYRAEAVRQVGAALDFLKAGKRVEADKALKAAHSALEKGIALHPRDGRRR